MAKSKFKEIFCPSCKKVTKMVILKEPENNKGWFECSRCHHSFCLDIAAIEEEKKEVKEIPEKEDCIEYSPLKEYSLGDGIFHPEWDDVGLVESKEVISNGNSVIVVKFKKSGVKKLIENFKQDEEDEETSLKETFEKSSIDDNESQEKSMQDESATDNDVDGEQKEIEQRQDTNNDIIE